MPRLTPILALDIAKAVDGSDVLMREDGRDHLKYAYRVRFPGALTRELSIVREPTADGVTVYLNKQSCSGGRLELLDVRKRFPGVRGLEEYPMGYVGKTGDKGISSAAGGCPSLLPLNNDVLRVSCSDTDGFRVLVGWYAGVTAPKAVSPRHVLSLSSSQQAPSTLREESVVAAELNAPEDGSQDDEAVDSAGRLADPAQRLAVELRAVDLAKARYEERGFQVQVLGKPFDLLCIPTSRCSDGSPVIHVEVKGSTTAARSVHLTRNEISDARQEGKTWRSDLFIARRIELRAADAGAWAGHGGEVECFEDWYPDDKDLEPTDFVYRVPRDVT